VAYPPAGGVILLTLLNRQLSQHSNA